MSTFTFSRRVHFSEGDPAGISFFANVYQWHHEAYESWISDELGIDYRKWFLAEEVGIPIRKSEAEYFGPFVPGRSVRIDFQLTRLGTSSLTLVSLHHNEKGLLCAKVQTVHVFMDAKTGKKLEIPAEFRQVLESRLSADQ